MFHCCMCTATSNEKIDASGKSQCRTSITLTSSQDKRKSIGLGIKPEERGSRSSLGGGELEAMSLMTKFLTSPSRLLESVVAPQQSGAGKPENSEAWRLAIEQQSTRSRSLSDASVASGSGHGDGPASATVKAMLLQSGGGIPASTAATIRDDSTPKSVVSAGDEGKTKARKPASPEATTQARAKSVELHASGQSNLAARRNIAHRKLSVSTFKHTALSSPRPSPRSPSRKKMREIPNIGALYELGEQVMPSCHKGLQVLHGIRKEDNMEVVVKVRLKTDSGRKSKKDWLAGAEFMMNLPRRVNIAQILEVLEDPKAYYVVMEKVGGCDLFESIAGKECLPVGEVKDIVWQTLSALATLHSKGQIHRDVKLENIMLDRTPSARTPTSRTPVSPSGKESPTSPLSVKLIDFDTLEPYVTETPKISKDVLGTNQYIAQEAYEGRYSPASDVFAVGVIAYRLLTGKFPFKNEVFDDKPGENWVGSPKMKEIRNRLCSMSIRWNHKNFEGDPLATKLIMSMLAVNEDERPTAKEALRHPWFGRSPPSPRGARSSPSSPTAPS